MKTQTLLMMAAVALSLAAGAQTTEPRLTSWFTSYSGKYARVYTTTADLTSGTPVTTWSRNSISQTLPAYCGIQEVDYSTDWVYIRSTGLGSQIMGPWYLDAAKSSLFPNLPANQKVFYRLPRTPSVPTTKTLTGLGSIGYFVDGVAMFDSRDGYYWNGSSETGGGGTGYWNRDAYVNESITFDPALAHQEQTGTYHYHANPIALRYLMGDHVDYQAASKTYSESTTTPTRHSPILGWVRDGYPIYGPYGYSNPTNPASGVRRMVSGYVLRNGQNGTDNLTATGRTGIPAWAARVYGVSTNQTGPSVSTTYPLGRYMEDNAYLGDLGKTYGVDFDLDEYNGRWCVTPEFPGGTYAYFVSIGANGAPAFPYNMGRAFYGNPTGSSVSSITETVTTNFVGGASATLKLANPAVNKATGAVTLTWSAVEGGTYTVQGTSDLSNWTTVASNVAAVQVTGQAVDASGGSPHFYRVARTALASYDSVYGSGSTGGNGISSISPNSGARGAQVTATITLSANTTPGVPPQNAPINSLTIGTIAVTGATRPTQYTIQATFTIPANAATGAQTVTVVFPGPPSNPSATVTYTLANGFTIN